MIVILGTTASGKSDLALKLAEAIGGEIVSIDSMQVYRGMDIGTAKPTAEERARVPHHVVDVVDPWESFSVRQFVDLADAAVDDIHARGKPAIAVGGTMLYFKAFYQGLFEGPSADPAFRERFRQRVAEEGLGPLYEELKQCDPLGASRIHMNDQRRIERALEVYHLTGRPISELQQQWAAAEPRRSDWQWILMGLRREKEGNSKRINQRVRDMVAAGLVEEARRIWADPRGVSDQAGQAVGYQELFEHFEGKCPLEYAIEQIKIHSRNLAKNQRTWMRRLEDVAWIDVSRGHRGKILLYDALRIVEAAGQA